jgi:hypothetical protein
LHGLGGVLVSTADPETAALDNDNRRLACRPDDPANPTEVTVFVPESESPTTEWITISYDDAVPATNWE